MVAAAVFAAAVFVLLVVLVEPSAENPCETYWFAETPEESGVGGTPKFKT